MKVGYLRKPCAEGFLQEQLKAHGAESVICDTEEHEALPALLDSLNTGDTLYLWSLWHLSMNTTKVQATLDLLHEKGVLLYLHGEFFDFDAEETKTLLKDIFDYHNGTLATIKNRMEGLQRYKDSLKQQKDGL